MRQIIDPLQTNKENYVCVKEWMPTDKQITPDTSSRIILPVVAGLTRYVLLSSELHVRDDIGFYLTEKRFKLPRYKTHLFYSILLYRLLTTSLPLS